MNASNYKIGTVFKDKTNGDYWDIVRFSSGEIRLVNRYTGKVIEQVDLEAFEERGR